ncbi:MAG: ABC transporter ATP-binding protein [Thermodesulfobacteriota bacterium]
MPLDRTEPGTALLRIEEISVRFGNLAALNRVGFDVISGQVKALIGPNGAGKTTLFNVISGFLKPATGSIHLGNTDITRLKPHEVCRLGVARTFQITRLFKGMTVLENIMVGCQPWTRSGIFSCGFRTSFCRDEARRIEVRSREILHFLGLSERGHTPAENLPIGEQKLVEIGRALATSASLLLLDEPAGGLNDAETERLARTIRHLQSAMGITILLVEHDMSLVLDVADEIVVLNYGRKIAEGPPPEVQTMEEVVTAYLGKGAALSC